MLIMTPDPLHHVSEHGLRAQKRALQRDGHVLVPGLLAKAWEVGVGSLGALLTSTSTGPNTSRVVSTMALTSDASVTSVVCARDLPPLPEISSTTAPAPLRHIGDYDRSPLRGETVRQYPAQPEPPPVTIVTLSSNRISTSRFPPAPMRMEDA